MIIKTTQPWEIVKSKTRKDSWVMFTPERLVVLNKDFQKLVDYRKSEFKQRGLDIIAWTKVGKEVKIDLTPALVVTKPIEAENKAKQEKIIKEDKMVKIAKQNPKELAYAEFALGDESEYWNGKSISLTRLGNALGVPASSLWNFQQKYLKEHGIIVGKTARRQAISVAREKLVAINQAEPLIEDLNEVSPAKHVKMSAKDTSSFKPEEFTQYIAQLERKAKAFDLIRERLGGLIDLCDQN